VAKLIPLYTVKNGRGFWQPKPAAKAKGFVAVACGPDGPEAWAKAHSLNERWRRVKLGLEAAPSKSGLGREEPRDARRMVAGMEMDRPGIRGPGPEDDRSGRDRRAL
jgi:hypothetical protein